MSGPAAVTDGPSAGPPPVSDEYLADYHALRDGIGAVGSPRDVVAVTGREAAEYLQGQCSQDLTGQKPGQALDALLLEPDGKLSALVRILLCHDGSYLVDVDRGWGDAVVARLLRFRLRTKVEIRAMEWPSVALRGTGTSDRNGPAAALLESSLHAPSDDRSKEVWAVPVDWGGSVGLDLLGPGARSAVPDGTRWCGEEAFSALRIESGIPAMGHELDPKTIAAEAGLVDRCVSFTKGCYTGQELIARLDARGNRVARRLAGVVISAGFSPPDAGLGSRRLVGGELWTEAGDRPKGSITSAAWCPGVGGWAGIGYLHRSAEVPGPLEVRVPPAEEHPADDNAEEHPGGWTYPATARPLPLVDHPVVDP